MTGGRYVLQFPTFSEFDYVMGINDRDGAISRSQVFYWLDYGKLKEIINVTPSYQEISVEASGKNRVLDEVIIEPIPALTQSVTLAEDATLTIIVPNVGNIQTTNGSVASGGWTKSDNKLVITALATGSATITVYNTDNDLILTINVTVS